MKCFYRSPPPPELLDRLRARKAELLTLLSPPWNETTAAEALAAVNARLDRALQVGEADTPAKCAVIKDYRTVARRLLERRDPLLFEALAAVEGLLARWRMR